MTTAIEFIGVFIFGGCIGAGVVVWITGARW